MDLAQGLVALAAGLAVFTLINFFTQISPFIFFGSQFIK